VCSSDLYKIVGSDGTTLTGGGEGGSLYRCRLDGSKLERWATGFWNPFASGFDAFGRLFTVDNDADSRPPCRLLHIIQGGDYGYRYRNGRKGLHPFTSWNGEIPGTLPMVAGTGEAPSGILAYESDGLPEEYIGNLLVTSWGDHRIDRFRLKPKGASFESLAEPLIVGGENFRPVSIACAPDGSLYCSDWVLKDYKVHGRGRVWRISAVDGSRPDADKNAAVSEIDALTSKSLAQRRNAAINLQLTPEGRAKLLAFFQNKKNDERGRIEAAWAHSIGLQSYHEFWESETVTGDSRGIADYAYLVAAIDHPRIKDDPSTRKLRGLVGGPSLGAWGNEDSRKLAAQVGEESIRVMASLLDPGWIWESLDGEGSRSQFLTLLNSALDECDPFVFSAIVTSLGLRTSTDQLLNAIDSQEISSAKARTGLLLAVRIRDPQNRPVVKRGLANSSANVQRICVQWVAEEKLKEFRPQVEAILNDPQITADLFLATLAALEMLDGIPPAEFDKTPPGKYVLPLVEDEKRPASVRALALRMVDPNDPALGDPLLSKLLASENDALKLEALRTLLSCTIKRSLSPYARLVSDDAVSIDVRAEAIAGLVRPGKQGKLAAHTRTMLVELLSGDSPVLKREALRSLRAFVAGDPEVKAAIEKPAKGKGVSPAWMKDEVRFALGEPGGSTPRLAVEGLRAKLAEPMRDGDDAGAGRRAFYHANGAGCFKCHTVNGRGGKIGPDLSTVGRALSREKLLDSILEPSKEIAPQFVTWSFETTAGKVHTGMLVFENEGKTTVGDAEGKLTELKTLDIANRVPQKTSVMPEKLPERMSLQEFRDLLAYLEGLR
jgi:putative heme-binding domain-containing protein